MKKSLFSLILITLMMFPLTVTSANNDSDAAFTLEAAEVVIAAFSDIEVKDGLRPHLSPYLLEISQNGHSLPIEIKDQLKVVGFNFSSEFVSRRTTSNERAEGIGLDQYYDFGIFRFHYTLDGNHSVDNADLNNNGIPDYIDQMVESFTYVYDKEINEMGYYRPPGDGWLPSGYDNGGSDGYDVYIRNISANYYGYVMSEYMAQNTGNNENSPGITEINAFTSYMAMRNNYSGFYSSNNDYGPTTELEAMQVTAAHEFFHAIQYGYDGREKPWLLEATATWIEEIVYDDINDCYQYMPSWFDLPHTSLDKTGGTHWYGSYIFFKYIDEHLGGSETIRLIFEKGVETDSQDGDYSHQAISDGLEPVGSSFQDALNKMAIANRVMSSSPGVDAEMYRYEEAEAYPIDGPDTYTTINFSAGDTVAISSTNLQEYASQYIKVNTESPVNITLTNISGPQEDLSLHGIFEDYSNNFIIQTSSTISFDSIGYSSIYLAVVSQNTEGTDWNYELSFISDSTLYIVNNNVIIANSYNLLQNYPNPFNPITSLRYDLPEQAQVTLTVYDMLGREVAQLVNTTQESGYKSVQWNATDMHGKSVSAGVYLYQIQAGEFIQTKKMVLLK